MNIDWLPLTDAYYYKVFLIEDTGTTLTTIVQSQTKNTLIPQRYTNTGNLFTSDSGAVFINNFTKIYTTPSFVKVTAFVIAYDTSNSPCFFPENCITINGNSNTMTLDYTLSSPNKGTNYYLNDIGSRSSTSIQSTLPLPSLQTKAL